MFDAVKKNKYDVDVEMADAMLQNVFKACDTEPNIVPLEKMVHRSRLNMFTDNLYIVLASVLFVLTLLMPLVFPHSKAFISADPNKGVGFSVVSSELTDTTFSITFESDALDSGACYMEGNDNSRVTAIEYNRETNTIVFPYAQMEYNIYIFDINGKAIHLLLSPHD